MSHNRKRMSTDGSRLFGSDQCAFCGISCDDEVLYGKLIKSDSLTIHYNCLFLSSGLSQQGDEEKDDLYGFLPEDIEAELRRGKKLFCSYCRKRGATIGCCILKCKKSFHLPCGLRNGVVSQFFDSFPSFCQEHAPKQKKAVPEGLTCRICCEDMCDDTVNPVLYSPCCKNSWFHKRCLQKHAISAGSHFFKCPLCNNSKDFIREMEIYGIHIPEKDASWELEGNAYQDLLTKPECGAASCLCSRGRKYCPTKKSGWTLLPCKICGSDARHKNCENLRPSDNSWICSVCKTFEMEIRKKKATSQEDTGAGNVKRKIECPPSQDNKKIHSAPSTSLDSNTSSQSENDTKLPESGPLHIVSTSDAEMSENINHARKPVGKKSVSANSKGLHSCVTESKSKMASCLKNSDSNVTEKQIVDFKDLKNLSSCSVTLKRIKHVKSHTVKRREKKAKFGKPCSSLNHVCICKYFGQECGKFRI